MNTATKPTATKTAKPATKTAVAVTPVIFRPTETTLAAYIAAWQTGGVSVDGENPAVLHLPTRQLYRMDNSRGALLSDEAVTLPLTTELEFRLVTDLVLRHRRNTPSAAKANSIALSQHNAYVVSEVVSMVLGTFSHDDTNNGGLSLQAAYTAALTSWHLEALGTTGGSFSQLFDGKNSKGTKGINLSFVAERYKAATEAGKPLVPEYLEDLDAARKQVQAFEATLSVDSKKTMYITATDGATWACIPEKVTVSQGWDTTTVGMTYRIRPYTPV